MSGLEIDPRAWEHALVPEPEVGERLDKGWEPTPNVHVVSRQLATPSVHVFLRRLKGEGAMVPRVERLRELEARVELVLEQRTQLEARLLEAEARIRELERGEPS